MDKVYLVMGNDGNEHHVCDVFSTPEKAEVAKAELEKQSEEYDLGTKYWVDSRSVR